MALRPFQILTLFAAALWLGGLHPAVAQSQTASAWQRQQHSAARLISAEAEKGREGTVWRAGVEITLDPGWKTYWRNPGDSGIPPRFNFSASTNVRDVKVAWPAPARFADGVGMSIGYADRVILPLRIRPRDPAAPVVLRLKLDYAVCEKLCVPVDVAMDLPLGTARTAFDDALKASEARVPRKGLIGDEGTLSITAVRRVTTPKPAVLVDVHGPGGTDLFVEGPNERWNLPLPDPVGGAPPGVQRFVFALDGIPPDAKIAGAQFTLTAVSSGEAVEAAFHLD